MGTQQDLLNYAADIPTAQAAVAMCAEGDQIHVIVAGELNHTFSRVPFQNCLIHFQTGFLQSLGDLPQILL